MTAAMVLYMLPVHLHSREFTMDWETTSRIPWGILILFGGGLSLAAAVQANGVAEFLGSFAAQFGSLPLVMVILLVTAAIVFLTELTSNVATTTSLVPVLAALAPGLGIHPYLLIIPATVAASCAFMLPVATPPNAIVFGSGAISLPQMIRAGFLLNILAIFVVTLLALVVVKPWLGI
jgi:sodium-dependent dicarboxylate transporter 2/3/5